MNKRLILFFITFFISLSLIAQTSTVPQPNYKAAYKFSPDNLKKKVFSTSVNPHWLKNSTKFWYSYETTNGKTYYIVNPDNKSKIILFDNSKMAALLTEITKDPYDAKHLPIKKIKFIDNNHFQFEVKSTQDEEEKSEENQEDEKTNEKKKDEKKKKVEKKIFYFEYNVLNNKLIELKNYKKEKETPKWANISPDSSTIVFAKEYNLYWMDKENYLKAVEDEKDSTIVEHQITEDGVENYGFGQPYSETDVDKIKNKKKRKAVYAIWSKNSDFFAIEKYDERAVKDLWVVNSIANPRPTLESYKYTMPGDSSVSKAELYIFKTQSTEFTKVNIDRFKDQSINILKKPILEQDKDNDYNPRVLLADYNNNFFVTRTSRDLKRIDICRVNSIDGSVDTLIEERMNTYVETRNLGLVDEGKELIHWSERDGWAHFYLYDENGNLKNRITSGPWHCESIVNIDSKNRVLYFTANAKENDEDPYYQHLYSINLDGNNLKLLNKGNFNHRVRMDDESQYFVDNYSRVNTVPKSALYNRKGNLTMQLEEADLSQLFASGYKFPEPFKMKADDGITDIYGVMYKPFDFDSTKKYPLLEYVYPGPQTEAVAKSFSSRMNRTDRMAQVGFIVITLGNRGGHPSRSKWYHNYGYGNLRDYGLADKKYVAEQLADKYSYIDIEKVGIFGHSGGGFMSTAAMLVYPDFFKVAVSSSGNHDNHVYNRWWSEKHHGVKEKLEDDGSVKFIYDIETNPEIAKNLKGHLLITTGDIDNNVHPANTIRLANALIKANKRFDFFLFPGQRHGYGDMTEYFFWLKADYFSKYLLNNTSFDVDIKEMNISKQLK